MSGIKGRQVTMTVDGEAVAGVRVKTPSVEGTPVDVTDDDSTGWNEVLDNAGQMTVSLSVEGLMKGDVLRAKAYSENDRIVPVTLTYPDGGEVSGDFYLQTYEEGMTYNEAVTFTASLMSTGTVSYTPAS